MPESNLPSFLNSHLQETAQKAALNISNFRASLDAVSSDIKNLERWLRKSGVCLPFRIQLDRRYELSESNHPDETIDFYHGSGREITEQLAWDRHESSGQWRIIYIREVVTGELSLDKGVVERTSLERKEIEEFRPLIEMPGQIRLHAYEKLPELLFIISEGVKPNASERGKERFWQIVRSVCSKEE